MCGIIGYVGGRDVVPVLMEGLRSLEYRGYDSAGICVAGKGRKLELVRAVGKIGALEEKLREHRPKGTVGLGHSRWATHGRPSEENAHPHTDCEGKIVVIHNGIIENYRELKERLRDAGHKFASETDTEILAHLFEEKLRILTAAKDSKPKGDLLAEATRQALHEVEGAYAIAVLWSEAPGTLVAAKTASPLVIGEGKGEMFLASDVPAFMEHTRRAVFLEDGEMAVITAKGASCSTLDGRKVSKKAQLIRWGRAMAEKEGFQHFMLKEIYEQPQTVADTLRGRLFPVGERSMKREAGIPPEVLRGIQQVELLACGTAFYAGLLGKYFIEHYGGVPAEAEVASEFRYRDPIIDPKSLVIAISQSGETADTLAAVRLAKAKGAKVLSVCNCVGSALTREADYNFHIRCGPEYGVASTKAFMGMLTALATIAMHFSIAQGKLKDKEARLVVDDLLRIPGYIDKALKLDGQIEKLAKRFHKYKNFLFIGRHVNYPIAMEGALKLKEISYIHAEGYPAGEMKHGPIALIDESMPVVAIATGSCVFEKVASNIEEAKARGAVVIALCNKGEKRLDGKADHILRVPKVDEFLSPLVNIVPLQLLAYHIAHLLGCDVDQPRNLAKSVTVE